MGRLHAVWKELRAKKTAHCLPCITRNKQNHDLIRTDKALRSKVNFLSSFLKSAGQWAVSQPPAIALVWRMGLAGHHLQTPSQGVQDGSSFPHFILKKAPPSLLPSPVPISEASLTAGRQSHSPVLWRKLGSHRFKRSKEHGKTFLPKHATQEAWKVQREWFTENLGNTQKWKEERTHTCPHHSSRCSHFFHFLPDFFH